MIDFIILYQSQEFPDFADHIVGFRDVGQDFAAAAFERIFIPFPQAEFDTVECTHTVYQDGSFFTLDDGRGDGSGDLGVYSFHGHVMAIAHEDASATFKAIGQAGGECFDVIGHTEETDGRVETGTGVFNGDIGVIESINPHIMQFTVRFDDDKVAVYEYSDIEELTLAYAVTIHKSQGSEFDTVVIALDANYMLQTRNLLYTAVTRAKKMVVLVGARKTVARMIRNNETARRYSLLINLIDDEIRGRVFP